MTEIINSYANGGFLAVFVSAIIANVILSGDNAVVIAMASRSLPAERRMHGIILGNVAVVILRIALMYLATMLLNIPYMRFCGGLLVLAIVVKLLIDIEAEEKHKERPGGLVGMIAMVLLADLVIGTDNILAVASASKGNPALLALGFGLGIPIVVVGSCVISSLMERFPLTVFIGAAVLGMVAAEMIISDPLVSRFVRIHGSFMHYGFYVMFALAVIATGRPWLKSWRSRRQRASVLADTGKSQFNVSGWDIF